MKKIVDSRFDGFRYDVATCGRPKLGANKVIASRITRRRLKEFDRRTEEVEISFPDRREPEARKRRVAAHCDSEFILFA